MFKSKKSSLSSRSRLLRVESLEPRLTLAANPITLVPSPTFAEIHGRAFSATVAVFSDSDQDTVASDFSAQINWGDGTTSAGTITRVTSSFRVTGQHVYATTGARQITVAVQDVDGAAASDVHFITTNLTTDPGSGLKASFTDANLKNPWGIAFSSTGPFWLSAAGTGKAVSYNYDGSKAVFVTDSKGVKHNLVINVPAAPPNVTGSPLGVVLNATSGFIVNPLSDPHPATYLFSTSDGLIAAWNSQLGILDSSTAKVVVNGSASGAMYTGLAIGSVGTTNYLYAANAHTGTIDVFDTTFQKVASTTLAGAFTDPALPSGYVPQDIKNIGGKLYVTYATPGLAAVGNGVVDIFNTNGTLVGELAGQGSLDLPWGMALAPANFGAYGNALLVANTGNGTISAFNASTGTFLGQMTSFNGSTLVISGLHDLQFGDGFQGRKTTDLFFTAGTSGGADGLFGRINFFAASGTTVVVR